MISILQQLFYSPFSTRLLQTNWNNEMKIYSSEYFMLTSLQACFSALKKKNGISIDLKEWLQYYRSPTNEEININQQEDSHEFLMNFFDQMNSILANTSDPSIIEDLFVSTMKVSIECSICHGVSSHLEVLNCISLDVEEYDNLDDSLKQFLCSEMICSMYYKSIFYLLDYYCETCNQEVKAIKRITFTKPAENLIFQLKRFSFDVNGLTRQKMSNFFSFPNQLSINDYSNCYSLHGIVCHNGAADAGHFVSYIQVKPGEWYCFNDSIVMHCSYEEVMKHSFGEHCEVGILLLLK